MEHTISTDQHIINTLLLNASFIDNIGLMHGKMGISIFFFHLARQTKNQIYEDYAGELIDEIYEEITANTPVDFENGLAGIGWGIEYLVQNGFIEADTDEVLEEFDKRILHEFTYHFSDDINLTNGLTGFTAYFAMRLRNHVEERIIPQVVTDAFINLLSELQKQIPQLTQCYTHNQPGSTTDTDYFTIPALIILLSEIHIPATENFKNELVNNLANNFKNPENLFDKLFLCLAFLMFQKTYNPELSLNNKNFIEKTLEILTGQIINDDQTATTFQLSGGATGIAILYHCIFNLTQNIIYSQKAQVWAQKAFCFQSPCESVFAGFKPEDENTGFGFANGIAGLIMANSLIQDSLTSNIATHD
jgi:lantibiotic modifying enzyme